NCTTVPPKQILSAAVALIVLVFVVSLFLLRTAVPAAQRLSAGFLAYYVGAQVIRDGETGEHLYDDRRFAQRVMQVSDGAVSAVYFVNPPTLAVAWLPLSYLSAATARRLWIGVSVLCLGVSLLLIASEFALSRRLWAIVGLSALFTLPVPVRYQFLLRPMYPLLLFLHIIACR